MHIEIGITKQRDFSLALEEIFSQAVEPFGKERPNIGLLFTCPEFASLSILKALHIYLPYTPIVGLSTFAVLYNYKIYPHSLLLCLISSENLKVSVAKVEKIKKRGAFEAGEELGIKLLNNFAEQKRCFALIFCDGLLEENSRLLLGLQERLGRSFPIVGGSASDNLKFKQTYLYFNDELLTDAAVGVLFGGKTTFNLSTYHGWRPLGKPHTVTQSRGNILKEVDNQPAVNFYQEYFGKDIDLLKKDLKYISTLYPIGIFLEGEEEYLLRNIISIEDDGSLVCQGDIPEGSNIRLMIGTKDSCLMASRQAAEELTGQSSGTTIIKKKTDIILIFDSISRYLLLRRSAEDELKTIRDVVAREIPVIGCYTYGEQAPLKALSYQGRTHFHNQSIVLTAMGD